MRRFLAAGMSRLAIGCVVSFAMLISGCGGSDGPTTYKLSGTVTYKGQAVPQGNITLSPDSSKGNEGPGASAEIKDGKFETPPGKGVIGGPYVLLISGYDGIPVQGGEGMIEMGKAMFPPYKLTKDLPKEDSELSIEVPAK